MANKSLTPTKRKGGVQDVIIDTFAGIDRSTARHRIEGKGERLYEASNVFPYIQGRLQRRKDAVQTNSRSSNAAFPTFPTQSLSGNADVKKVIEFNSHICIFYEDDGDTGKVLMDRLDTGNNALTAVVTKTSNGGSHFPFTPGAKIDAVGYGGQLYVDAEGSKAITIDKSWVDTLGVTGNNGEGVCEVFLQSFFHVNDSSPEKLIGRTAPNAGTVDIVTYNLEELPGNIIKLLSFGYQTSSAGATTSMLMFKGPSIWVLTGIGTTESMEQVTGNIGLVGKNAITYTPFGVCFVGKDTEGLLNIYLIDRNYFVLQTIGHELYEELNHIPKANYSDIVLSYHRNRMVRIAITKPVDIVSNSQEYWLDFYNGLKKRTLWGPFLLPSSNSLTHSIAFSGGTADTDSGFFMLIKESDTYKIYEEVDTDTYNSTNNEWDNQLYRSKLYDFGKSYGLVHRIILTALANGAKFKASYEKIAPVPMLCLRLNGVDGATTTIDEGVSGHTITFVGNAQIDTAIKAFGDSSLLLDGTGDWLTIPDHDNFDFSGGKWTVEGHILADSLGVTRGIYSQATDSDNYFYIYIDTSGFVTLKIVEGGSEVVSLAMVDNALVINRFYHIRVCELDDDYYIFINGFLRATVSDTSRPANYTSNIYIGANWDGSTANNPFAGNIDSLYAYNICMSNVNFSPILSDRDLDNKTKTVLIDSYQMGTSGEYANKPIRLVPPIITRQFGIKLMSDFDPSNNKPLEVSQLGFKYEITDREVIE